MNDNHYKQLMEDSPIGYAYHRIICDEEGIPCEYELIEGNIAFEKLGYIEINGNKKECVRNDEKY